jgi:hypothetical protein
MKRPLAITLGSAAIVKGFLMLLLMFSTPQPASACISWTSYDFNYCASMNSMYDCWNRLWP